MPRAHCLACGDHVVIDPAGHCPEGHDVGTPGARIEGSLGSDTPHPDEPEPWVARVELDVDLSPPVAAPVREIRPPAAPLAPEHGATGALTGSARTDDLLRELHSLGELDDLSHARPATSRPRPEVPRPGVPEPVPPGHVAPPSAPVVAPATPAAAAPMDRSTFDDLSALEAAVHALGAAHDASSNGSNDRGLNGHSPNGRANGVPRDTVDGTQRVAASNGTTRTPPSDGHAAASAPPSLPRSVADQLDDLFAAAEVTAPVASAAAAEAPPEGGPSPETHGVEEDLDLPERWAVLADVADLAERRAAPETQVPPPSPEAPFAPSGEPARAAAGEPAAEPATDRGIDLGNFTARGKRVGHAGKGRRRLFGR